MRCRKPEQRPSCTQDVTAHCVATLLSVAVGSCISSIFDSAGKSELLLRLFWETQQRLSVTEFGAEAFRNTGHLCCTIVTECAVYRFNFSLESMRAMFFARGNCGSAGKRIGSTEAAPAGEIPVLSGFHRRFFEPCPRATQNIH